MGYLTDKATSLYTGTKFLKLIEVLGVDVTKTFAHMFRHTVQSSFKKGPEPDDLWVATEAAEGIVAYVELLDHPNAKEELADMMAVMKNTVKKVLDEFPGLIEDCRREKGSEDRIAQFIVAVVSHNQKVGPSVFADGLMMALAIDIVLNDRNIQQCCQEFCDVLVAGFRQPRRKR